MLRFKRDDGNEYTSWEYKKMSELSQVNQGLQIAIAERSEEPGENKYFYITNEFLKKNSNKKYYIENPPSSVIATVDDILMTRTGNTGIVVSNVEGVFHNNFFKINFDRKKLDKNFLIYYLNHPKTQNKILILAGTSTIPDLNHKDFYSLDVPVPCLEEQQKIADFLSEVDNIIAMYEKEIESLEMQKKGAMQKIFSQEVRFKADDGSEYPEWEERSVKELTTFHKQGYYTKEEYVNDGIKLARVSDLYNPKVDFDSMPMINMTEKDYEAFKVSLGDFLIARSGSIGRYGIVTTIPENVKVVFGSFVIKFNFDEKMLDIRYFGEFYSSDFAARQLKKIIQAGANININAENIKSLKIPLPCLEEQQKIADFLSEFDNAIEFAKEELEVWKNIKKGLLQQMFE